MRVPASCVAHVPEAEGSFVKGASIRAWRADTVQIRTAHLRTCAPAHLRTWAPGHLGTWAPQVAGVPEDAPPPRWAVFLAGALAGTTATCLCYPLDVVPRRGQRWPGAQQPMRLPAAPEARPPARGSPLGPGGAPSPLRGAGEGLGWRSFARPKSPCRLLSEGAGTHADRARHDAVSG